MGILVKILVEVVDETIIIIVVVVVVVVIILVIVGSVAFACATAFGRASDEIVPPK